MQSLSTFDNSTMYARPYAKWMAHLEKPNNTRILFSGIFGSGKSTFLAHYFNLNGLDAKNESKYRAFSISPVHYSISTNEDILKYIKYDILLNFLKQGISFEQKDTEFINHVIPFIRKNVKSVIPIILSMIPKVGKDLKDVFQDLEELFKKFEEFSESQAEHDGDLLAKYMEKLEDQEGSLFENDIIVKLIQNKLSSLKSETGKQNILIIDDLDRLDPDHIFRILNVFSAHLHTWESSENKFGFDKVIIVCDLTNLKNIFKAKFGSQTDFNGYIDKFYSIEVFHFINIDILREAVDRAIGNLSFTSTNENWKTFSKKHSFDEHLLLHLCSLLVEERVLNLRPLKAKLSEGTLVTTNETLTVNNYFTIPSNSSPVLLQIQALKNIVGGYDYLHELFERIPSERFTIPNKNQFCNIFLFLINHEVTFSTNGRTQVKFNGRLLYADLSASFEKDIKELKFSTLENGMASQFDFTKSELKQLLLDFIIFMKQAEF